MPHSFDLPSHVAALDTWSVYWILKVVKNHVAGYYTSSSKSHQPVDEIRIFYQFHCLTSISTNALSVPWIPGCISFLFTPPTLVCCQEHKIPISKKPNVKRIPLRFQKPCLLQAAMALVKSFKCNRTSASQMARKTTPVGSSQLCFVSSQMKPIQNGDAPKHMHFRLIIY